ncbi:TonB-dependent siderophore receptor [Pseudorhodoferax soli]|uniref:TonB-dependent siderophore receptor n=1 Tax=Pseudorhodoferax soli TaxID=545864 RepID=UPI0011C07BB4|nr:TonB-dependent receptor [Pseudorhodoferax soli]
MRAIARSSGVSFSALPSLLQGRTSSAVAGRFTPEEAARRALAGTGLELVVTANGTLSVREAAPQPATSKPPLHTAPTTPAGAAPAATTLNAVTVTAAAELPSYLADRPSTVATKSELLPRLTPFSIDQISRELMQERGDTNIFATLESFAGLTTNSSVSDAGGGFSRAIQIRGFSNGQTLINGIPVYSDSAGTLRGTDSLESVELLRGPAGLYYGSAEPGGVISYNYKRPRTSPAYVVRLDTDDKGSLGAMADLTGPVDEAKVVSYRLVGSARKRVDDQDHIWSKPQSLLAAVTVAPNRDFTSTLTYERLDTDSVPEQENNFLITSGALAGQYYPVSRDFFWGSLNDRVQRTADTVLWDATWSQSEALKIRGGIIAQRYEQWWQNTRATNTAAGPDADGNVQRYVSGRQSEGKSVAGSLDVSGTARHGQWRHDWLVGMGLGTTESSSSARAVASQSRSTGAYPVGPINIYNPTNTDYPYQYLVWEDPLVPGTKRSDANFYMQDMLHLPGGATRVMLGLGWARFESDPRTGTQAVNRLSQVSPRVAAMHDINDATTVYASYGESFVPQSSTSYLDTSGAYITQPVEGVQYEVGIKRDVFGGSGLFTAALFRVDKKNEARLLDGYECAPGRSAVAVGEEPEDACYVTAGLTRAQGLELRLSGQILDGWIAQVGYSYTQAKYKDHANAVYVGRTVEYTPRHNLVLWNKFRVHRSDAAGEFHVGAGLKAWSKVHGTWSGTPDAPAASWGAGYGLVDAGLFWEKSLDAGRKLSVNLNITNLLNKRYYDRRRFPMGTVLYGDERRVALSAQLAF